MVSDESMTVVSSIQGDEFDDIDVGFDHDHDHQTHPHNLSRLSMCSSSMYEDDDDHHMGMYMSRLSIESFDADVDDDDDEFFDKELSSDDSDKEPGCYSLPATPPRRLNPTNTAVLSHQLMGVVKDYASENEVLKGEFGRPKGSKNTRKRRIIRERCADMEGSTKGISTSKKKDSDFMGFYSNYSGSFSGESEGGSAGGGVVVITRPKGGRRSLCMDLEEVKACRDLGFELEHGLMLEMPSAGRVSLSSSNLDTVSSDGTSPLSNWRISSPGDDPRDVKARLKVWAQAVALASSSSRHCI